MNSELKNKPFLVKQKFELEEDIEKHDELNPALFNEDSTLKSEVKEKITEIVNSLSKNNIEKVLLDLKTL